MPRFFIAVVLCVATAISGAWTLQWDANSSWPAGTTVTACLNSVCVNGVTGNSQSFSESYSPGTVLHGTAQAVPPVGYQCGDPLAACPPSAIAEIAQTIPSDQQYPNRSAWIATGGVMAAPTFVAQYATAFNSNATPKTAMSAVAIDSGDVLVIVGALEDAAGTAGYAPTFTENGSASLANSTENSENAYSPVSAATYTATAGENITITAAKGASARTDAYFGANVVRFSGASGIGNIATGNGSGSPSISITTTQANSAIVVIFSDWNATSGAQTFTSNGGAGSPTSLTGYVGDGAHYGVGIAYYADAGTAGSKTVGMSAPTGQKWRGIAIEVKGSAGGNGSVSITGSAGTGGLGAVSVSGSALASLVGLAGSATSGAVGAGGGATLVGLSGASGFGTLSASGSATQSLVGLSVAGAGGVLGAGGGASLTGPSVTASAGLLGAGGGGSLIGTSSSSGVGTLSASGTATQSIVGLAGSGAAGTMGAGGGTALSGSPGAASAGLLSVSGAANQSITGIFAAGAAGLVSISSDAAVSLPAVFVTGYAGNVSASAGGSVNISVSGVAGTGALGSLSLSGTATKTISGASGTGGYGLITVSGDANKTISGTSAGGSAGTVTLSANALLSLLGVQATPSAGIISVSGGASVSLSGISASGQVGSIIVSAGANAQITLSGATATGYVGTLALSGNGLVLLDGNQAQGLVGTIRLTEVITPGGRLLAIASEDRTIIVQIENRIMTVMADDPNLRIV